MSTATAADVQQREAAHESSQSKYTKVLSWPTTIEPSTGEVRLRLGDTVDALVMRAGLGGQVNHQLIQAILTAPVIVVPGIPGTKPDDWIFLTQPRTRMRESTIADLMSIQVGWYESDTTIPLPAFGCTEGGLRWLAWPEAGLELPTWGVVVGAVRRTLSRAW